MNKKEYIKELSPSSTLSYSAYGELFLALQTCLQDNDDTIFKCLQFEILKKQCGRNAFVLECWDWLWTLNSPFPTWEIQEHNKLPLPDKTKPSLGILALMLSVSFCNFAFTELFLSQTRITLQAKGSAAGKSFETQGRWMKQFLPNPREDTLLPWSQNTSKNPPVLEFKHLLVEQKHEMKESNVFLGSSFEISLVTPFVSSRVISHDK